MASLVIPRQLTSQPQGAVEIDWSNPLTLGLVFAWIPGHPEITTGKLATTSLASIAGAVVGVAAANSPTQRNNEWDGTFCTTSDYAGTGDFTMAVLANPASSSAGVVEHLFAQKNDAGGSPYAQACLMAHSADDFSHAGGSVAFITYSSTVSGVAYPALCDGKYHLFMGKRYGTVMQMHIDGVPLTPVGRTLLGITQASSRYVGVGCAGNQSTNGARDGSAFAAMWNRALSDAEAASIAANPWQIFKVSE